MTALARIALPSKVVLLRTAEQHAASDDAVLRPARQQIGDGDLGGIRRAQLHCGLDDLATVTVDGRGEHSKGSGKVAQQLLALLCRERAAARCVTNQPCCVTLAVRATDTPVRCGVQDPQDPQEPHRRLPPLDGDGRHVLLQRGQAWEAVGLVQHHIAQVIDAQVPAEHEVHCSFGRLVLELGREGDLIEEQRVPLRTLAGLNAARSEVSSSCEALPVSGTALVSCGGSAGLRVATTTGMLKDVAPSTGLSMTKIVPLW